jgi:putative ABC transport system permease protein
MTQVNIGDVIIANIKGIQTPVEIRGVVRNFPTLFDEAKHGFIITARSPLIYLLNREISLAINANELWIETDNPLSTTDLVEFFPDAVQIRQLDEERQAIRAEPLLLGLRSVTYLGYLITAILSLVGFATYFYLSTRQREVVYGVLRSLGLSPKQLYGSLLLEQAVTIITGLTLGTLLGLLLNSLVLPGLPISTGGHPPIPPFQVYQDWSAIVILYLFLLSSFMVVVGIITALLWRSQIHRVLRIGQE